MRTLATKRRLLRRLLWISGPLTVLVVALYLLGGPEFASSAWAERSCNKAAIHIHKGEGELILTCGGRARIRLRAKVSFGGAPRGHKQRSGDQRTPEGRYYVCTKKRSKRFHRFLGISYPSPRDARRGHRRGLISRAQRRAIERAHRQRRRPPWNTRLGGAIGIHGVKPRLSWAVRLWNGVSRVAGLYRVTGFSDGCIVTDNSTIEALWRHVRLGTPVYIHPVGARKPRR